MPPNLSTWFVPISNKRWERPATAKTPYSDLAEGRVAVPGLDRDQGVPAGRFLHMSPADGLQPCQPHDGKRKDLLVCTGRIVAALAAYDRAIALVPSSADARFLGQRRARLLQG